MIGAMVPSFFLLIIIAIGLPSLAWLTNRLLSFLGFMRHRYKVTVALAALMLAATFNGYFTTQSYLWLRRDGRKYASGRVADALELRLPQNSLTGSKAPGR